MDSPQAVERDSLAARTRDGTREGFIIPIGGAEEKIGDTRILSRFVELCGGDDARIAIIPTASQLDDTGAGYEEVFHRLGVKSAHSLPFKVREDCEREDWLEVLNDSDGIFMTGGNQLRLSTIVGGTQAARAIRDASARGVHVAGTSAGAGFMSEHMIAFGGEGLLPRAGLVTMAPGLGLTNRVQVTVVARSGMEADGLASAVSVLGAKEGRELLKRYPGSEAYLETNADLEKKER